MSDAIVLDVLSSSPVQLDVGDADPIAREEIAALAGRVEAIEADYVTSEDVMDALGGEAPALVSGSSRAILGDPETASWMQRTTAADGAALIEAVHGRTLRWNQLIQLSRSTAFGDIAITCNIDAQTVTINGATEDGGGRNQWIASDINIIQGHKYLFIDTCNYSSQSQGYTTWAISQQVSPYAQIVSVFSNTIFTANAGGVGWLGKQFGANTSFDNVTGQLMLFDLTVMFGAGNEPSTVAEFEALFPEPYYPYDPGSLLPVRMEGVETVGFNQWDEEWEVGTVSASTGELVANDGRIRSKNYVPVFPNTTYFHKTTARVAGDVAYYDEGKNYVGGSVSLAVNHEFTTPANARYMKFSESTGYGTTYNHDICINVSDPARNGTYEPHWSNERAIPASTYFPDGMRSAGSVRDELRADAAVTRVGAVDLGALNWSYSTSGSSPFMYASYDTAAFKRGDDMPFTSDFASIGDMSVLTGYLRIYGSGYTDATAFNAAIQGKTAYLKLATPTTTPIDPPLPLSYRVGAGGTERVMVASGTTSAPPVFATRYPLDPADLAASIAPRESATAEANHAVGDLVMLGWTLCKVTTAIARGEAITIGTNVTKTSVAAEITALS